MTGPALADLILGTVSPSGKLPVSLPRTVGQIPLYYNSKNTGRPYLNTYKDTQSTPLFPYGYGLSYSSFSYTNFKQSKAIISFGETLIVSATVKNEGTVKAEEIVFLFVRDLVGSYTRPIK
jgi:beta-glucosidase